MAIKAMSKADRISFWFMLGSLVLVGALHLGTPLLATLFSYFVLRKLHRIRRKWVAVLLFALIVAAGSTALARFTAQAVVALPAVADDAIPTIIDTAEEAGVELPFTDWNSLKAVAVEEAKDQAQTLGRFAKGATRELALLILGIAIAVGLFLNPQLDLDRGRHAIQSNLYSLACEALVKRFRLFFQSFHRVMGAQIIISAINTVLTSIFVLAVGLPNALVVVGITFLCGLLPVIGNLVSNVIITAIAFTVSPQLALVALAFLVVIHKLEYFLNSKIIGDRIRNPIWLTLLGLILGETLMGIPGMILAPVLLDYIKAEASAIEVREGSAAATSERAA